MKNFNSNLVGLMTLAERSLRVRKRIELRAAMTRLHVKQVDETREGVAEALVPFFSEQIKWIENGLKGLGEPSVEEGKEEETAERIVASIFDADDWTDQLLDTIFPPLFVGAAEAIQQTVPPTFFERHAPILEKASSASEWALANEVELPPGVALEFPDWVIAELQTVFKDTFAQDYWKKISATTGGDVSTFIKNGLKDGKSIRQIANTLQEKFPQAYSKQRAITVARTESAGALNGARRAGVDAMNAELPDEAKVIVTWLSILADTTRDTHANLDGVAADEEGMFNVGGTLVPYPAHYRLPAEERVNCYCTTVSELPTEIS